MTEIHSFTQYLFLSCRVATINTPTCQKNNENREVEQCVKDTEQGIVTAVHSSFFLEDFGNGF